MIKVRTTEDISRIEEFEDVLFNAATKSKTITLFGVKLFERTLGVTIPLKDKENDKTIGFVKTKNK